jgi:PAS domain S-box-containing protein
MNNMTRFVQYGLVFIVCCGALGLSLALGDPLIWFILAVLVSTLYGGLGTGIAATVVSVGALLLFVITPHISAFVGASLIVIALVDTRRRLEVKNRKAEELFNTRLTVDSIPGMVGTLTPDGQVEFQNSRLLAYLGRTSEQMTDWPSIVHPMDRDRVVDAWLHSTKTGAPLDVEHRGIVADGSYRWFSNRGLPMFDKSGKILRWFHLIIDTDDRKKAEEVLRESEENLRRILNSVSGFITIQSPSGEVQFANQPYLEFLGISLEELKNWHPVIHPDDVERVAAEWSDSMTHGTPLVHEVRVRRADGAYRWLYSSLQPVRNSDGHIIRWCDLLIDIDGGSR